MTVSFCKWLWLDPQAKP